MSDAASTAQREQNRRQGLIVGTITLPLRLLGVLVGSLLFSILMECIGMHLFWKDQGWQHSQQMLQYELGHLSKHFTRSVVVQEPGRTAHELVDTGYEWVFVRSGLLERMSQTAERARAPSQGKNQDGGRNFRYFISQVYVWTESYLIAAAFTTLTFLVRLLVLALTLPLAWIGAGYDHGIVTPSGSFLPPLAEWIHNGLFYGFGLCLYVHRKALMARYERHWPALAGLGLVGFLLTALLAEVLAQPEASAFALVLVTGAFTDLLAAPVSATRHLQFWMALAYNSASWLWSFALIGLFLRHLGQPRAWLAYLADSSYWVYLVHLPLTMGFGARLYGVPIPVLAKMALNVLATTALCLASYLLCVRFTAVSQWLNGRRHTRNSFGDPVHAT